MQGLTRSGVSRRPLQAANEQMAHAQPVHCELSQSAQSPEGRRARDRRTLMLLHDHLCPYPPRNSIQHFHLSPSQYSASRERPEERATDVAERVGVVPAILDEGLPDAGDERLRRAARKIRRVLE